MCPVSCSPTFRRASESATSFEAAAYSYISDDEFAGLGISLQELHDAAVANLAGLPSASISIAKVPGGAEGWLHATDDNFAAVRILLPDVQREFTEAFGEPFLFSLSHRDDCFCWSLFQSQERQQTHVREALEALFARGLEPHTRHIMLFP